MVWVICHNDNTFLLKDVARAPLIAERGKEREALISIISALYLILLVVLIVFGKMNTHKQIVMCWCMFVFVICRASESFVKIWSFNTFMWSFINSTASSKETANIVSVIQFFSEKNTSPLGRQCPRPTRFWSRIWIYFSQTKIKLLGATDLTMVRCTLSILKITGKLLD